MVCACYSDRSGHISCQEQNWNRSLSVSGISVRLFVFSCRNSSNKFDTHMYVCVFMYLHIHGCIMYDCIYACICDNVCIMIHIYSGNIKWSWQVYLCMWKELSMEQMAITLSGSIVGTWERKCSSGARWPNIRIKYKKYRERIICVTFFVSALDPCC